MSGQETFIAKMKVLLENVEHHAEEEETDDAADVRGADGASLASRSSAPSVEAAK